MKYITGHVATSTDGDVSAALDRVSRIAATVALGDVTVTPQISVSNENGSAVGVAHWVGQAGEVDLTAAATGAVQLRMQGADFWCGGDEPMAAQLVSQYLGSGASAEAVGA